MTKRLIHWLLAAISAVSFVAQAAAAGAGHLVTAEWLAKNLDRGDVYVIDASPTKLHAAGHIPGAVNVDVFMFWGSDLSSAQMEKLIQSWGVSADKQVVIYDQGGTYFATTIFFDLYYYGFPPDRLVILDGGFAKWQVSGGAITKDPTPAPKPGTFRVAKVKDDMRVRLPEVLAASGDPGNNALVEALDPAQHFGGMKFFDRAGHIPHAIMTPAADYFNADKTFKSPEEIRRMLTYLGIKPEQQLYTHCGGGIAASVPFFAAKVMLDYPRVKLYKESQLGWLRDDRGLPFWTYDAPSQLREREWLNGWNQQMLRMFGASRISVIDVRPAASFKQSHVPFAINVPADEFRANLSTPAKLAEELGRAGVDVDYEAVIVSDGGLNPDSALAYLMLERVGQKKISVFTESVDDWAFAGLAVAKEADAADPKKAAMMMPAPAKSYPANLRAGMVVGEAQRAQGLYPRIYLASGKSLPAKLPEGKVIHVPYTDLVDAKGAPKPAKDIWTILVKAGVPRYAEIISISDDPGEAAANYFVLKLMGYPDVKVLTSL
jgi:3-mercaptopyruvate sulfurtransferase SseA